MPRSSCGKGRSHSHRTKSAARQAKGRGPRRPSLVERLSPPTGSHYAPDIFNVPSMTGAPVSPALTAPPPSKGDRQCSADERKHRR
jgi:hypothetical protein